VKKLIPIALLIFIVWISASWAKASEFPYRIWSDPPGPFLVRAGDEVTWYYEIDDDPEAVWMLMIGPKQRYTLRYEVIDFTPGMKRGLTVRYDHPVPTIISYTLRTTGEFDKQVVPQGIVILTNSIVSEVFWHGEFWASIRTLYLPVVMK
jgi:hypothetical protein